MANATKIPLFRRFVIQSFPYIEQDFDALTDYQLISKVVEYLNKVIESQNGLVDDMNDLETAFNTLKDYVDHYFDNLDVQEEINNKLDQMAEDGQLTQLIAQFLSLNAVMSFPSVADMKLAENLVNGSTVETYGFYNVNDGGGAKYLIRTITNDDTVDEKTIIELYDDYLIAELIKEDTMNVKQFGAKGDGITDDTLSIQTALNYVDNVFVPKGTFMVNAITHINMQSNNKLTLDNSATIKAITNDATSYGVIWIEDVTNVEISGGTIEGERLTHTGATGEWGHCIRLLGACDKIYVHDITLKNTWGDGICCNITGTMFTERVHVDNVRRNGYSVVSAKQFISTDDIIENTNGTNPQAGVDIEPDNSSNVIGNITFNNLYTKNNSGTGLAIAMFQAVNNNVDIQINNHHDDGSRIGETCAKNKDLKGNIVFNDSFIENTSEAGFRLWRCFDGDCCVKIIRPYIYNCNKNSVGALYGSGITGYALDTDDNYAIGNIEIFEPYIHNYNNTIANAIMFSHQGSVDPAFNNIKIINPIYIQGKHIYLAKCTNTVFTDLYNVAQTAANSGYTIQTGQYYSLYTNTSATSGNKTLTIPDNMWIGRKLRIRNMNSTYNYSVKLPTTDYCYQMSATVSPKITLNKLGDTIELEKVSDTEWIVTEINCTPTVS